MRLPVERISTSSGILILAVLSLYNSGCVHRRELVANENKVQIPGVMSVWSTAAKSKGKVFELDFHMMNESKGTVLVMVGDINCGRGPGTGTISHVTTQGWMIFKTSKQNASEVIPFGIGQERILKFRCGDLASDTGEYKVLIHRVFENHNNDQITPGKVLATELTWKLQDKLE